MVLNPPITVGTGFENCRPTFVARRNIVISLDTTVATAWPSLQRIIKANSKRDSVASHSPLPWHLRSNRSTDPQHSSQSDILHPRSSSALRFYKRPWPSSSAALPVEQAPSTPYTLRP